MVLPFEDAMLVVTCREVTFAALNAALVYVLFSEILRSRSGGVLVSLAFTLPLEHWLLATRGEEKDMMLFFLLLVMLPFFHLRGWIHLQVFRHIRRSRLAALVGGLLALSVAVHLQNGLLVPFLLLATALSRDFRANWRRDLYELAILYGVASISAAAFFLPVAWWAIGVRDTKGFLRWLFEYHMSGQWVDTHYVFAQRILQAYTAFRQYLFGWHLPAPGGVECVIALGLLTLVLARAWRAHRDLCLANALFLGLLTFHFFNYRQEPEPWAGASIAGLTLVALASWQRDLPVLRQPGLALWVALISVLGVLIVGTYRNAFDEVARLYAGNAASYPARYGALERHFQTHLYEAQIALRIDLTVENEAIILVENRHLVNAFRVYTDRMPIVPRYLDRTEEYFNRPNVALTVLSRHFYIPASSSNMLRDLALSGRPLYYVTGSRHPKDRVIELFGNRWSSAASLNFRNWHMLRWRAPRGTTP